MIFQYILKLTVSLVVISSLATFSLVFLARCLRLFRRVSDTCNPRFKAFLIELVVARIKSSSSYAGSLQQYTICYLS